MAKKKKKMTKAQAAAARRDDVRRKGAYEAPTDTSGPKDSNTRLVIIITMVILVGVVIFSTVYAVPTLMGQ